jgi:hypothetical protein
MALSESQVLEAFRDMIKVRDAEKVRLDRIRKYVRNDPKDWRLVGLAAGMPTEVRNILKISRVNMLRFIVTSRVQRMYVDGYRAPMAEDNAATWEMWQANGMDAEQIGVHRAGLTYGAGYVTVLPGDPRPVIRGYSPRMLTVAYGNDHLWPRMALEQRKTDWRLIDATSVYTLTGSENKPTLTTTETHGAKYGGQEVCPVIRFRDTIDYDDPVTGIVEPHLDLQEQINVTTFGLLVAQHYGAFRQRYIIGWLAESEEQKLKSSAAKLWTFEERPDELQIGEFDETDLDGYIESREATLRHLATVSQTPVHELTAQLVNLSAEALAAARDSQRVAVTENQEVMGEAWEQTLNLAGEYAGVEADPQAYVRWRDVEARSLGMLVDALGKAVTMLGIPPQELWARIADAMGVSQQELESWKAAAQAGNAFAQLEQTLTRQAGEEAP